MFGLTIAHIAMKLSCKSMKMRLKISPKGRRSALARLYADENLAFPVVQEVDWDTMY